MKMALYIVSGIGATLGAYIPVWLWNVSFLDISSLLGGFVGAIAGLWVGYVIAKRLDF